MTHVTCRLTAKNRDQLRNRRSVIEYGLPLPFFAFHFSAPTACLELQTASLVIPRPFSSFKWHLETHLFQTAFNVTPSESLICTLIHLWLRCHINRSLTHILTMWCRRRQGWRCSNWEHGASEPPAPAWSTCCMPHQVPRPTPWHTVGIISLHCL